MVPVAGGEVLTCGHPGCDCAVRVEAPCACRGSEGGHYTCICGAQLVAKVP
ncbi:MAG TPA: metallothionein [Actinomycetota bacterium]|nr:metallothionein [Actinomycetota bacterium]